jgi:hypothetical protein
VNSTGLGDVARHCFSPPARRPPGANTTFKDVDGPFHETAFVGDTHTHTCTGHMRGHVTSTARSLVFMQKRRFRTRKSRRIRFIARGSIRVITRLRYSIKTKKNSTGRLSTGGPPTNRGFHRIRICISRFPVLSRPGASILSFPRTRLRPSRSSRTDRRATAPCFKTRRQSF